MKLTKTRYHQDWGHWKPVKLTHRERLEIYRKLQSGTPTGEFAGMIPFPQLENIFKEFHPGSPKPKSDGKPRGIMGNEWFCEAGCGAVMQTKPAGMVFKARKRGVRYLCKACIAKLEEEKKAKTEAPAA